MRPPQKPSRARPAVTIVIAAALALRANRDCPVWRCGLGGAIDTHVTAIAEGRGGALVLSPAHGSAAHPHRAAVVHSARSRLPCGMAGMRASARSLSKPSPVAVAAPRTAVTGIRAPQAGEQTIRPDASLLFVAGAGWTKKQADGQTHPQRGRELILGFLHQSRASLGGSKSLVDLSGEGQAVLPFMTHLNQIGQTGATPRHPKGLATCCHGEEPHVVGWRFITERRAVNLDANCGWARGKADVLYVADAFEVMRKVNELLRDRSLTVAAQ